MPLALTRLDSAATREDQDVRITYLDDVASCLCCSALEAMIARSWAPGTAHATVELGRFIKPRDHQYMRGAGHLQTGYPLAQATPHQGVWADRQEAQTLPEGGTPVGCTPSCPWSGDGS